MPASFDSPMRALGHWSWTLAHTFVQYEFGYEHLNVLKKCACDFSTKMTQQLDKNDAVTTEVVVNDE